MPAAACLFLDLVVAIPGGFRGRYAKAFLLLDAILEFLGGCFLLRYETSIDHVARDRI